MLRNSDISKLPQVQAAREGRPERDQRYARSIRGERALTAHASIPALGWQVFVETPLAEAYAPIYSLLWRSGGLLAAALLLAVIAGLLLARRMVLPIEALQRSADRLGRGDLSQRVAIRTGDELEALGEHFNIMAARVKDSYETLEARVQERTRLLEQANQAKSRFLAVASHDLRQPLHALGLFAAQLRGAAESSSREHLFERIQSAVTGMNELFDALLDITKLDAGVLTPELSDFPIEQLLQRIERTFGTIAEGKGLRFHVVPERTRVRSDIILLERILLNFASNAVRYTERGGVLIGCRKRGRTLRIEIWDTGSGIPGDRLDEIFGEFYRLNKDRGASGGLGLGLAIVERLAQLLGHRIEVKSRAGRGSRFSVSVPLATDPMPHPLVSPAKPIAGDLRSRRIVIIDDDPLVLDAMGSLLAGWGCDIIAAASEGEAVEALGCAVPDLIISDYHLAQGLSGIAAIERLRAAYGIGLPAVLITADTSTHDLLGVLPRDVPILLKPVNPMTLRALLSRLLSRHAAGGPAITSQPGDPSPEPSPQ